MTAIEALKELVRLRDLRLDADRMSTSGSWDATHKRNAMYSELKTKEPLAWEMARRALLDDQSHG